MAQNPPQPTCQKSNQVMWNCALRREVMGAWFFLKQVGKGGNVKWVPWIYRAPRHCNPCFSPCLIRPLRRHVTRDSGWGRGAPVDPFHPLMGGARRPRQERQQARIFGDTPSRILLLGPLNDFVWYFYEGKAEELPFDWLPIPNMPGVCSFGRGDWPSTSIEQRCNNVLLGTCLLMYLHSAIIFA